MKLNYDIEDGEDEFIETTNHNKVKKEGFFKNFFKKKEDLEMDEPPIPPPEAREKEKDNESTKEKRKRIIKGALKIIEKMIDEL